MTTVLRLALGRGAGAPWALEVDSAAELATSAGRRSVVRYTVRGLDGVHPVPVVGKMFAESQRAHLLHDHLRLLHAGPFGAGDLRVPEPLGMLGEQRLVLYRHCDGVPLDRVTDPGELDDGVRRAARWLSRLHTADVRLPRTFSLNQEATSTRQWASLIGNREPILAARSGALAGGWVAAVREAGPAPESPIHKDFHAGHVLVATALHVIDLDEARQGDPMFDVAHFCTYLELTQPTSHARLRATFLEEYHAVTGRAPGGAYLGFCAYTWLKIAKQSAAGSGPCRQASPAQRRSGAELALARGEACLSA
jgi:aminoglycoside phosphotransferase (APT) family kinase protein